MSPSNDPIQPRNQREVGLVNQAIEAADSRITAGSSFKPQLEALRAHLIDMRTELSRGELTDAHVGMTRPITDSFPDHGPDADAGGQIIEAYRAYEQLRKT